MGLFDGINSTDEAQAETDRVKGQKQEPLTSGIYNLIVKHAYGQKSKGGAMGIHIVLTTPEGRDIRMIEYITSGDAKGNKTYYEKKNKDTGAMEKFALPGFSAIDSLCKLIAGKGILSCPSEVKTIKLYDFDAKKDMPKDVDMLVDLVGKPVCGCVLDQIQDKTKKNEQTGKYEPTGATYHTNVIDKFLDAQTRKTASEINNNLDATFADLWAAKWENNIDDQSTEVKGAGLKGAPQASGDAAPKDKLFS